MFEIEVKTIQGENQTLAHYQGQVMLIVNTATKCGFAPQFKGLQKLYETYREQGFVVLGFPSSQFMNQELADHTEIAQVCELDYGVTFPLFSKIDVNGKDAHPLFKYLSKEVRGVLGSKSIKWNFTKFLIDRNGNVVQRFAPSVTPEQVEQHIQKLL